MNPKPKNNKTGYSFYNHAKNKRQTLFFIGIIIFLLHIIRFKQPNDILNLLIHHNHENITKIYRSNSDDLISPTNLSHIIFGVVSSAKSWQNRKPYVDLWWGPNMTRGIIWFDREPVQKPWPDTSPPYKISENISEFKNYDHHEMRFAIRMTRVILETFKQGFTNVRWFVMADDDTFLFIDNLVDVLNRYDHRKYYYIGEISECVLQNTIHSFKMAFGGGGFALSFPLFRDLSKILDGCIKRYPDLYSNDHILQFCLAELGVSLSRFPGFHQFDLRGDVSGYLSAHPPSPVISFHHINSINPIFPKMTRHTALKHLMKAVMTNPSRVLQQTVCYDLLLNRSFSVSWGYSVQIYESLQPPGFLQIPRQTFTPWNKGADPPFMFNVRPVTDDPCFEPHVLFFDRVDRVEFGSDRVVTSYVRKTPRGLGTCDGVNSAESISRVLVSSPIQPFKWDEERRECCTVSQKNSNVTNIEIRACVEGEALKWTTLS